MAWDAVNDSVIVYPDGYSTLSTFYRSGENTDSSIVSAGSAMLYPDTLCIKLGGVSTMSESSIYLYAQNTQFDASASAAPTTPVDPQRWSEF